jgi:hypothetical protein
MTCGSFLHRLSPATHRQLNHNHHTITTTTAKKKPQQQL